MKRTRKVLQVTAIETDGNGFVRLVLANGYSVDIRRNEGVVASSAVMNPPGERSRGPDVHRLTPSDVEYVDKPLWVGF